MGTVLPFPLAVLTIILLLHIFLFHWFTQRDITPIRIRVPLTMLSPIKCRREYTTRSILFRIWVIVLPQVGVNFLCCGLIVLKEIPSLVDLAVEETRDEMTGVGIKLLVLF